MTGFPPVIRNMILDRDLGDCVRCGTTVVVWDGVRWVPLVDYSLHHRRPRGMGGSRDPRTNSPVNGIVLCGTATTGCHQWVESHRADAYDAGFLVHQGIDPAAIPVLHHQHGLTYLTNEGYSADRIKETTP